MWTKRPIDAEPSYSLYHDNPEINDQNILLSLSWSFKAYVTCFRRTFVTQEKHMRDEKYAT